MSTKRVLQAQRTTKAEVVMSRVKHTDTQLKLIERNIVLQHG